MRTRKLVIILGCSMLVSFTGSESGLVKNPIAGKDGSPDPVIEKVSFQNVTIKDNFWCPKIEKNRMAGISSALQQSSHSIENFDIAARKKKGLHKGNVASDSDVYKIIQGAAYALHHTPDKALEIKVDSIIDRILAAQQPDGYLFTYWTINDPSQQWRDIPRKHELYCAGHLIEAAVAYSKKQVKENCWMPPSGLQIILILFLVLINGWKLLVMKKLNLPCLNYTKLHTIENTSTYQPFLLMNEGTQSG